VAMTATERSHALGMNGLQEQHDDPQEHEPVGPPILVSRVNREIVDGLHRYHAARMPGSARIKCTLFDGDAQDASIESVRRSVTQGLPLTLRELEGAASRYCSSTQRGQTERVQLCADLRQVLSDVFGSVQLSIVSNWTRDRGEMDECTG
jgi:hypothetical protein